MGDTNIAWADKSLNFLLWRCDKVSEGCAACYMMTMARKRGQEPSARISGMGHRFDAALRELRRFEDGQVVFVNSMSDTYHDLVPLIWIQHMHEAATSNPQHTFLFLTKRPERLLELSPSLSFPSNLWVGTSVEMNKYLHRLDTLLQVPAAGHFVSVEPMLERMSGLTRYLWDEHCLNRPEAKALKWVILGGESGSERRKFQKDWAREIRDECVRSNTPFLFKQGSAHHPGQDRNLDGCRWNWMPDFKTVKQKRLF